MNHLLSCDWGSSSFRLRAIDDGDRNIIASVVTGDGASTIAASHHADPERRAQAFATYLKKQIEKLAVQADLNLSGVPVVISGMATSAHGWREVPYAHAPVSIDGDGIADLSESMPGREVMLIGGIQTDKDVMRGEESEIIGLFQSPEWSTYASKCLVVIPGTHSKHVVVEDRSVTDFTTYMTGDLYLALSQKSVLARSIAGNTDVLSDESPELTQAFSAGIKHVLETGLDRNLFQVRVNDLFSRYDKDQNTHFLMGLLIGSEAIDAISRYPDTPFLLCGGRKLSNLYRQAFSILNTGDRTIVIPPKQVESFPPLAHTALWANRQRVER